MYVHIHTRARTHTNTLKYPMIHHRPDFHGNVRLTRIKFISGAYRSRARCRRARARQRRCVTRVCFTSNRHRQKSKCHAISRRIIRERRRACIKFRTKSVIIMSAELSKFARRAPNGARHRAVLPLLSGRIWSDFIWKFPYEAN